VRTPSSKMTGVEETLTEVCATICQQIYHDQLESDGVTSTKTMNKGDFKLTDATHTADVIEFTNHGELLKLAVPPFVIVHYKGKDDAEGDALILGWRGSTTLLDWTADFASSPVASPRWIAAAPQIRCHAAYTALIESDLTLYEAAIFKAISDSYKPGKDSKGKENTRRIKQVILTGHSLGGGLAQVAHMMIQGQLSQPGSAWSEFAAQITCRTVAFAGPMVVLNLDPTDSTTTDFMKTVSKNACNIVFGCDAVPHGPGDVEFLNAAVKLVYHQLPHGIARWGGGINKMILGKKDDFVHSGILPTFMAYHHPGKVIYHQGEITVSKDGEITYLGGKDPVVLRDSMYTDVTSPEFRGNDNVAKCKSDNARVVLGETHMFLHTDLAYRLLTNEKDE
jgi:hypothetical protein